MFKKNIGVAGLLAVAGLSCNSATLDPSIQAVQAGDYTLAGAACDAMPGRGADVCRFKEGTPIHSSWQLVLPKGSEVIGGEVEVTYRDVTKSYPIQGNVIIVPFRDFFTHDNWEQADDGLVLAFAQVRYKTPTGEDVFKARGIALLVVTRADYDPLPMDSGYSAFSTTCKIQYSTAGRSALVCK